MPPTLNDPPRRPIAPTETCTSQRNIKVNPKDKGNHTYTCDLEDCRVHVKEYGDMTRYPCGRYSYVDPHFQGDKCDECDAVRFIMDSWSAENHRRAAENYAEVAKVPPLTHDLALLVLEQMGVSIKNLREMGNAWTPYQKIQRYSPMFERYIDSELTFVQQYELMEPLVKKRGERPPIQYGHFNPMKDDPKVASIRYRDEMTKKEIMQYILLTAVTDGLIDQPYINMALANFGIVPKGHRNMDAFDIASGLDGNEMYNIFQLVNKGGSNKTEVPLKGYLFSPARNCEIKQKKRIRVEFNQEQRLRGLRGVLPATQKPAPKEAPMGGGNVTGTQIAEEEEDSKPAAVVSQPSEEASEDDDEGMVDSRPLLKRQRTGN